MSAWSILGIEPTGDTALIRRAYVRRLKEIHLEDDPDGFHRLREARSTALDEASRFQERRTDADLPDEETRDRDQHLITDDIDHTTKDDIDASVKTRVRVLAHDLFSDTPDVESQKIRVVEIASLVETRDHWVAADQLKPALADCLAQIDIKKGQVDRVAFTRLIEQAAMLPRGPRRDVESACLTALTRAWRQEDGRFDRRRVARIAPLLSIADATFGWSRDDSVLLSVLRPNDVDALSLLLDVTTRVASGATSPIATRLRRADALAYFWQSAKYRALYDEICAKGRVPWRLRWFPLVAPHIWALYRRMWMEAALLYLLAGLPAVLVMASGARPANVLVISALVLFVMVLVTVGLCADRIVLAAAMRAARDANARCLFDRSKREAYLNARGRPTGRAMFVLLVVAASLVLFPYSVVLFMLPMFGMAP